MSLQLQCCPSGKLLWSFSYQEPEFEKYKCVDVLQNWVDLCEYKYKVYHIRKLHTQDRYETLQKLSTCKNKNLSPLGMNQKFKVQCDTGIYNGIAYNCNTLKLLLNY